MKKMSAPTSMQDLRLNNYRNILLAIEEMPQGISRTQLCQKTGLSSASVTLICEDLLNRGIIEEFESAFALTGRKPIMLRLTAAYGVAAALIVDSTHKASLCLGTMDCRILYRRQIQFSSVEDLIHQTVNLLANWEGPILSLGISLSQEYSLEENTRHPVHAIQPEEFVCAIQKQLPLAAACMEHDRMCLKAYLHFFQNVPCHNPVYLQFDDSISAATLSGTGGDLGHVTFGCDGRPCYCGKDGCAHLYCSPGILVDYLRKADSDPDLDEHISGYADSLLALCDSAARIYGADCLVMGGEMAYFSELLNPLLAKKMAESENPLLRNLLLEITNQQDILELKGTLRLAVRALLKQLPWEITGKEAK